jgi:hypothetical protein
VLVWILGIPAFVNLVVALRRASGCDLEFGYFRDSDGCAGFFVLHALHLIPEDPAAVHSWREHFEKVRRWFFTFYALFITASALRESALLGRSLLGVGTVLDAISIVNVTAGAIWRNRRIQIAVLLVELAIACFVSAQCFYAQH